MKVLVIAGGLALLLTSCITATVKDYFEGATVNNTSQRPFKDAVEQDMFDPDSSRYRNLQFYKPKRDGRQITVLCGRHNGKNRLGGYVGYRAFVSNGVLSHRDLGRESGLTLTFCLCRNGEIPARCK